MTSRGRYSKPKVLTTSTVFQGGKTQVPKKVRDDLGIRDGSIIVWIVESGRYSIKLLEA